MTKAEVIGKIERALRIAKDRHDYYQAGNGSSDSLLEMYTAGELDGLRLALEYARGMEESGK